MNIGLLSYHKNYNYGWNLQCYALMTVLKSMGHDVTLIDKRKFHNLTFYGRIKRVIKTVCNILPLSGKRISYEEKQERRGHKVETFFEKYINPKTGTITGRGGYKSLPHFDAFVVGSDQVWRKKLVNPLVDYFFGFVDYSAVLISYAASFGIDYAEYSEEEVKRCGQLIEKFKAVSVRESSGVKLIKDVYKWHCNPVVMPDPTLLLSYHDYDNIIGAPTGKSSGLFCYILDMTPDKEKTMEKISAAYSLNPYVISLDEEKKAYPPVEKWLRSFREAEFVFTDSFHGCVFSLIFRKPFIAYGNARRGLARFTSLLDTFEQPERLILSSADIDRLDFAKMRIIDHDKINTIQNNLREKALDFLSSNLNS